MLDHSLLLTDLYQLSMLEVYDRHRMEQTAVFELFVRKLPAGRDFLMAAGLATLVEFLERMRYSPEELDWLRSSGMFSASFIDGLAELRFTGDLDAMPEGTIFFPNEPIVRVTAPLPQAQLVESRLINLVHFQTVVASTAARMVLAAPEKTLVDFGFRRAHGAEAGLLAARASYLAGFAGTATLEANRAFGIPIFGTMAHSFIQAHDDEAVAFEHFARARPQGLVILIDTYDVEPAAEKVVALARKLQPDGIAIDGVRIDSGDLAAHARNVRRIFDQAGFTGIRILASGGIDETTLLTFARDRVPIDGYGIGASLDASIDAPVLDCAYKLEEYAGVPRRKRSEGKATWPGRKQVWRVRHAPNVMARDTVGLADETMPGEPLLVPVMRNGSICAPQPSLPEIRDHVARQLAELPEAARRLEPLDYPVVISEGLRKLAEDCDGRSP